MENTMRRVVVTGLGVTSPVGNTVEACWNSLKSGVHGIGPITLFDTTDYKTKIAAEVKDFDPRAYMDKTEVLRSDAFSQYGVAAASGGGGERRHRAPCPPSGWRCTSAPASAAFAPLPRSTISSWPGAPSGLPLLYPHAHCQHGRGNDRHSL